MIEIVTDKGNGITVGQRKDGSRAILWDDDTITWHSAEEFAAIVADDIMTALGL